jgi:beta-galactosidase
VASSRELFSTLVQFLGASRGLEFDADVPGVVATTTVSPTGDRLLHLLNPTGYRATVRVGWAEQVRTLLVPARTGHMLARGLTTEFGRLDWASSELTQIDHAGLTLAPSLLPAGHRVLLSADRAVTANGARIEPGPAGTVVITSPDSAAPLRIRVA